MNRLLLILLGAASLVVWSRRRAHAEGLECPPDGEIYRFAVSLGLVVVVVQVRSQVLDPAQVLSTTFTPLQGTYGMTEEEFWNRFAYFVRDDCQFYVYDYKRQSFSPSKRPMEDFLRWQRTGRI